MKMKVPVLLVLLLTFSFFACDDAKKVQETTGETASEDGVSGTYGAPLSEDGMFSLTHMLETLKSEEKFEGKISGEIDEVCVKKGCWLTMDLPNGESMRVTFKDYGFFVPKNAHGYPVVLEGEAVKVVTDVASLRHYAQDGGASAEEIENITEPKEEYTFVATGVLIQ
ncbi:DUF4920 domain-containing protein [Echinicola vietnamensis]|uniref:DUF4920 domain-containing protein n=1 Tax=Echinicola vietnamensis (strain DSM 17526 / LMG 23754 / KMM 6221) TaxID=926556 RepID=L0G0G6_ECHVK|nr:DUF4920 domain-containing protein [Echinicola vietnamensis]AGA79017.1 hypothetical protein Echvi_2778 [Echinicola vietnamensis DSM 17526]